MPLYIEENFTHVLRDKLRNGELDAIIIALPFNEADVLTLQLYDEPFYVLMPAQHPWTQKESIDASLLNDKSLLLLGEGHCFRDQVLEACPTLTKGNDGAKHTTVESSSLETIRRCRRWTAITTPPALSKCGHCRHRCRFALWPSPGVRASRVRRRLKSSLTPFACARWPSHRRRWWRAKQAS
jgi:DNA-binding transcriptional LysR family regulator